MKKLAIFACVMVVSAGAAIASTVSIPFFSDDPTSLTGFIGVQNVDTGDVTITVTYSALGSALPSSTALFAAGESLSWRPYVDVGGFEGNQTTAAGTTIGESSPHYTSGSVTIEADGQIVGRYVQLDGAGNWAFGHNVEIAP